MNYITASKMLKVSTQELSCNPAIRFKYLLPTFKSDHTNMT